MWVLAGGCDYAESNNMPKIINSAYMVGTEFEGSNLFSRMSLTWLSCLADLKTALLEPELINKGTTSPDTNC